MRRAPFPLLLLLLSLAAPPLAAGPLEDGRQAFQGGDYKAALELWRPLADDGDPRAQYNLALLYHGGLGTEKDLGEARRWYTLAAQQGNDDAQYNLGVLYAQGQGVMRSNREAALWWRQAAAQGHAPAQFNLGVMYAYGRGVEKDVGMALRLWRQAAEQGYGEAANALARVYEEGLLGVEKDPDAAARWK